MQNYRKLIKIGDALKILKEYDLLVDTVNFNESINDVLFNFPKTDTRKLVAVNKETKPWGSYICIRGIETDGHKYMSNAFELGISLFFVEKPDTNITACQIVVKNTRKALAVIAILFYDNPTDKFYLIGVTGTNGKTSIVNSIENIFRKNRIDVGSVGTLGYTVNGKLYPLERTTPDITELNDIFALMVKENIRYVVMEVSSHALKLDRVFGLRFDQAIFTNLSRDHLDFHTDMEDYFLSKKMLFSYLQDNNGLSLINVDDKYGQRLYESIPLNKIGITSKIDDPKAAYVYNVAKSKLNETKIDISFNHTAMLGENNKVGTKTGKFKTSLIGKHNAFNLSTAILSAALASNEIDFQKAVTGLPKSINGRLEMVESISPTMCFVDYAHTPDAIKNSCGTLVNIIKETESIENKRLITIVGAGGGRDKGKRELMLKAALEYSDLVIVTSDNPRNERVVDIIVDMVEKIHPMAPYLVRV